VENLDQVGAEAMKAGHEAMRRIGQRERRVGLPNVIAPIELPAQEENEMTFTRNHPPPTPEEIKRMKKMLAAGCTLRDAKKRFGHSVPTIRKYIKEAK
jgi:DNA invertase Pin-like site-specific DNA recombinase